MLDYHRKGAKQGSTVKDHSTSSMDDSPSKFEGRQSRERRHILNDWWSEIGAILLSAVAFVSIIITLYPHDRKPLPQWPYSISVNALISVFVVVFKAAILYMTAEALGQLKWLWYADQRPLSHIDIYDQATRGPLGAFKLVFTVGPTNLLPILGAVVTILMVIVDPFTQQLLSYYDCASEITNIQATVPATKLLTQLGTGLARVTNAESSVPPEWQQAFQAGIFAPGRSIPFECRTGNCTFPTLYKTLAFCSKCEDVSAEIVIENGTFTDFNYTGYRTSLPDAVSVISMSNTGAVNYTTMGVFPQLELDTRRVQFLLAQTPNDLFRLTYVEDLQNTCATEGTESWRCRGYGAASCRIDPCVKTYEATITAGSLEEKIVDVSPLEAWGDGSLDGSLSGRTFTTLDVACLSSKDRENLQAANYTISDNQKWLAYNLTWNISDALSSSEFPQSLVSNGCLYGYNYVAHNSLWGFQSQIFVDAVNGFFGKGASPTAFNGPQIQQQIFNWGNISYQRVAETFANISDSLTVHVRQSGASGFSAPATGLVMKSQTCLKVKWPWLSVVAILAISAWVFLVGTLVSQHMRRNEIPPWKSSLLPVLTAGATTRFSEEVHTSSAYSSVNQLKGDASTVMVQLCKSNDGVALIKRSLV